MNDSIHDPMRETPHPDGWTVSGLRANLEAHGFTVHFFPTAQDAADYLDSVLDGCTIGMGGSKTLEALGVYERLSEHNQVFWHWKHPGEDLPAAQAQVYLSSANAISATGEIVNIDGKGNRIAAYSGPKDAVYFIAGTNKVVPDLAQAIFRARNVAAPLNARRLRRKTPCALQELKCYDCHSPDRICHELSVLWGQLSQTDVCHVVLIDEPVGY